MSDQPSGRARTDVASATAATSSPPRRSGAIAGLVAGAVAVTIGMFVAGVIHVVSPIDAVGSEFIDRVPPWLKELAIQWFGTNDKLALRTGIVVTLAIAALIVGVLAVRWLIAGVIGIAAFGLIGALAACASARRVGVGRAAAADRHRRRHTAARPAAATDSARRRRDARPVAGAARMGSPSVPRLDRLRAAAAAVVAGGIAQVIERRRVETIREADPRLASRYVRAGGAGAGRAGRCHRRSDHAVHHAERRLLPHRHGAVVPADLRCRAGRSTSTGWSTSR